MQNDQPQRPGLICLSGLLCDAEIWQGVLDALGSRADARVFSFAGFSSITDMAREVLIRAPPRFAVAGHSMGGRVALEVFRLAPGRVTGIALLNTGVHPPADHEPRSRSELVAVARKDGMRAVAARWLPPMLSTPRAADDPLVARLTRMIERSTPDSFAAQVNALLNRPAASKLLGSIRVPVLLVSGTADTWSPPAQHQAMQASIPGSRFVSIQDAGHMSLIEQPAAVAAALADWIGQVEKHDRMSSIAR